MHHFRPPQQLMLLLRTLERTLLAIVVVVAIISQTKYPTPWLLPFNLLLIAIFIGCSWIIPSKKLSKFLYLMVEFGIILLLALLGKLPLFALLMIVLVIRSCLIFDGMQRWAVTGLTFILYIVCHTYRILSRDIFVMVREDQIIPLWFGSIVSFGLIILFLQLFVDAVTTERKSQQDLALANHQLQQYALKVEELATLQERNRIAREIHDSLGHTLTVFNFHLSAALRLFHRNPSKAEELLLEVKQLGDSALQEVSQSVTSLRTDPLHGQSLVTVISNLITKFQQTTGVTPQWEINIPADLADFPGGTLRERYKTAIYRITQESLTNMSKHAAMTEAKIQIYQKDREIHLLIQDNGRGFDLDKNTTGFGLQGIQERVMLLAGQLEIVTAPQQGCQITVILPLE